MLLLLEQTLGHQDEVWVLTSHQTRLVFFFSRICSGLLYSVNLVNSSASIVDIPFISTAANGMYSTSEDTGGHLRLGIDLYTILRWFGYIPYKRGHKKTKNAITIPDNAK